MKRHADWGVDTYDDCNREGAVDDREH
jgi:hypothetical protein